MAPPRATRAATKDATSMTQPPATLSSFAAELEKLTLNSRPMIDSLTSMAAELAKSSIQAATAVADAIVERAATCSPPHRLYALYLLDSLVKNVREPYSSLFADAQAQRLPRALASAWAVHPPARPAIRRLVSTWDGCLPERELEEARGWMAEQEELARSGGGIGGGVARPPLPPIPPHYQQQQQPQQFSYAQHQQQQQYQQNAPYQQQQAGFAPSAPPPLLPPNLPNLLSSLAASGLIRPPSARAGGEGGAVSASASLSPSPRDGGGAGAQRPALAKRSRDNDGVGADDGTITTAVTTTRAPLALSLTQRSDLSTARLRGPHSSSLAALEAASSASRPALLDAAVARKRLQEARSAAAAATAGTSDKRGSLPSAASLHQSRGWYVPPEAWIAGTATANASSSGASFFDGGGASAAGGKKGGAKKKKDAVSHHRGSSADPSSLPTAPADESQRSCALTGEPFESFFDEKSGEWRYRDSTLLDAAGAAALGLAARPCLVKASALMAGDDDDEESAEEEERSDDESEESDDDGENGKLDKQPSSVPLEQVEQALAEAAAAVGDGREKEAEEDEFERGTTTVRVKEEAAA